METCNRIRLADIFYRAFDVSDIAFSECVRIADSEQNTHPHKQQKGTDASQAMWPHCTPVFFYPIYFMDIVIVPFGVIVARLHVLVYVISEPAITARYIFAKTTIKSK